MKLISFVGWSGSGKTTLISGLIRELTDRGLKIAAIKHAPEKFYLEPESKDSFVYLKSGALESFLVGSGEIINSMLIDKNYDIFDSFREKFDRYDMILIEGIIYKGYPVFEVFNSKQNLKLKTPSGRITAIIGDIEIHKGIKFFQRENIGEISDYIEKI